MWQRRLQCFLNPSLQELAIEAGIWKALSDAAVRSGDCRRRPREVSQPPYMRRRKDCPPWMLDRLGPGRGRRFVMAGSRILSAFRPGLSGADLATRGVLQMLKFGARIVAPVAVEKLTPAKSVDEVHVLKLDCGAEIRCRVLLLALGVQHGGGWRSRAPTDTPAPASITPVRRSKPNCTTKPTWPWSAAVIRPAKPRCFWPNAARRGPCIC